MDSYEATRQRHLAYLNDRSAAHVERVSWPAGRLREERTHSLRRLLAIACERSAWHRRRLSGLDIETMDEDRLAELPVMTKDDLMANFDTIVTDPRVTLEGANAHIAALTTDAYFLGDLHAVASGGSSGVRGVFVWSWEAWADCFLVAVRARTAELMRHPELLSAPPANAIIAAENASHFTSAVPQTFASPLIPVHRLPVTLPLDEIVAGLNRVNSPFLTAYASMLGTLAAEARAGRLRISPQRVVSTAEPLLPEIREAVRAAWGTPIANMWGTSEGGITAVGCFDDVGMHVTEDLLIVDPVDAAGRKVQPGITSTKIHLTNLYNTVLPLIRYEITDEVTFLAEPCPCGSAYRRIADIHGRLDDTFRYDGAIAVHAHVFRSVLGRAASIVEYQVQQTPRGATIRVRANGPIATDSLARQLEAELGRLGCRAPSITLSVVNEIVRQPTGKLKRFVPLPIPAP
jgi:phenylacetate-CoA ligase